MASPPSGYRTQSEDTSYEAELVLLERWRALRPDEKAALANQASSDLRRLTLAGLRHRLPGASESELQARVLALCYGKDLVRRLLGIDVPDENVRIP